MKAKRKDVAEAIEIVYASLKTHLIWATGDFPKKETRIAGTPMFHKQCIKRYAKVIKTLAEYL